MPGATVTATMGDKKLVAVTDPQGIYTFPDLPDGVWNLQVEMLCFTTLKMEVAAAPNCAEPGVGAEAAAVRRNQGVGAAARTALPRRHRSDHRRLRRHATAGVQIASPATAAAAKSAAPPKKGSKAAAAAATAATNARPGFQRADLNASSAPPPPEAAPGRAASMKPPAAPATPCWSTAA